MGVANSKFSSPNASYGKRNNPTNMTGKPHENTEPRNNRSTNGLQNGGQGNTDLPELDVSFHESNSKSAINVQLSKNDETNNNRLCIYCDLCKDCSTIEYADCFCVSCEVFCCNACVLKHTSGNTTTNHVFLNKNKMPRTKRIPSDARRCRHHSKRYLRYYCLDYSVVCCSLCIVESYSKCQIHCMTDRDLNRDDIFKQITEKGIETPDITQESNDFRHVRNVFVKLEEDLHTCWITDCTILPDGDMAVVDNSNDSLKIVDIRNGVLVSSYIFGLKNKPWTMCKASNNDLIVTCGYDIVTLDLQTLKSTSRITVDDWTRGIVCDRDILVYVCTIPRPAARMITLDGQIVRSFELNSEGQNMFVCPFYVTISRDRNIFYITDCGNHTVTSINKRDDTDSVSKIKNLTRPQGLALGPRGRMFICGENVLSVVSEDFKRSHVVLEKGKYQNVCFSEVNNLLFVSHDRTFWRANCISIFNLRQK